MLQLIRFPLVLHSLTWGSIASLLPLAAAVAPASPNLAAPFAAASTACQSSASIAALNPSEGIRDTPLSHSIPVAQSGAPSQTAPHFLVLGGGGAPSYNEIALEKNVLYFQRTLQTLGFDPESASIYFANGTSEQATVRYLDEQQQQQFKPLEIPHLLGAATLQNLQTWLQRTIPADDDRPLFFYFTGHGLHNQVNENNNAMILWNEQLLSVQQFSSLLDRLPKDVPVVTMMSQCYAGAFANLIYEGGNPNRPVALQTRCGFFATIKSRPSVGCTPEVNEADYRDYSSSFFAGLSGRSRTGERVASADYNQDGTVSYAEAHAFAKVDGQTTDLPVSTREVWLQERASRADENQILNRPIAHWQALASPERNYVVNAIANRFRMDKRQSFYQNIDRLKLAANAEPEVEEAYVIRLGMELVTIAMEQQVRQQGDPAAIQLLDRLTTCEQGSWKP